MENENTPHKWEMKKISMDFTNKFSSSWKIYGKWKTDGHFIATPWERKWTIHRSLNRKSMVRIFKGNLWFHQAKHGKSMEHPYDTSLWEIVGNPYGIWLENRSMCFVHEILIGCQGGSSMLIPWPVASSQRTWLDPGSSPLKRDECPFKMSCIETINYIVFISN